MNLTADQMKRALVALDGCLDREVALIMGGGGALLLAHGLNLATSDIDAIPRGMSLQGIEPAVKQVASELSIPPDWLNPYFSTFTHTLPTDYGTRLVPVFKGSRLTVEALGAEEMMIMKCFAGRPKDAVHARALLKKLPDLKRVEQHIEALMEKGIPGADRALDFLDEIQG
jgi:hypothetical protein